MKLSGRTPLLRARHLETIFNVGEIYIKLEGTNPTGHKLDRVSEILIKDAITGGFETVLVDGSNNYIKSILHFAQIKNIDVKIAQFKNEGWKAKKFPKEMLCDFKSSKDHSHIALLKQFAIEEKYYLASEGYLNTQLSRTALEHMTEEITTRLDNKVDYIYTQLSHGYTLTSIYSVFLKNWIDDKFDKMPQIVCGTIPKGNAINEHYQKTNKIDENTLGNDEAYQLTDGPALIDRSLLAESLKAVWETKGKIVAIDETTLNDATKLLRKHEHLKVSNQEAYAFAAFYQLYNEGQIQQGKHVIVLNEAKSDVKIDNINDFEAVSKQELVTYTRQWLAQYSDSTMETQEAIENALEKGFILLASRNGEYEGICIVVNLGFDVFIPTYHLAYIGTHKSSKGRGVGTKLIQRALDLTNESLSLHVDLDNKGAKKLYEKMGFKHCYNRMIFKSH